MITTPSTATGGMEEMEMFPSGKMSRADVMKHVLEILREEEEQREQRHTLKITYINDVVDKHTSLNVFRSIGDERRPHALKDNQQLLNKRRGRLGPQV